MIYIYKKLKFNILIKKNYEYSVKNTINQDII